MPVITSQVRSSMLWRHSMMSAILAVSVLTYSPAEAGLGHQILSLFGHGTIRTHLPKEKAPVPQLINPAVAHVVLIILENGSPAEAEKQSFMIDRANEGMVLNQYFAVAHPSQPNY